MILLLLAQLLSAHLAWAQPSALFKGFECGGGTKGNRCELRFYFDKCRSRMELSWPQLFLQGQTQQAKKWDRTRANWCTVRFFGPNGLVRETQLQGPKCDKILDAFADALRVYPEKPWQEGVCSLTDPSEGLVVAKEAPAFQHAKSVVLPGVGRCELQGPRVALRCAYPDDRIQQWLEEFSKWTGVPVSFYNPGRQP